MMHLSSRRLTVRGADRVERTEIASPARLLVTAVAGYLLGTIPSASVAARLATGGAVDLRKVGSGNPGAVNAMGSLGASWGSAVLAVDIAKAAMAARLGQRVAGVRGAHVASTAAVVGHCHPAWSRFRGGKGVACSVGQCLATFPAYFPIDLSVAALVVSRRWQQRAFISTGAASAVWVGAATVWWRKQLPNLWGPSPTAGLPLAAAASSVVILGRFVAEARRR